MRGRAAPALLVALLVLPTTWLRTEPAPADHRAILTAVPVQAGAKTAGELTIAGLWRLTSPNSDFGSYSALLALPVGGMLAVSDRGRTLRFSPPGAAPAPPVFGDLDAEHDCPGCSADAESATRDPASGSIWIGYEGDNAIVRARGNRVARVEPAPMHGWGGNSGPEAMTRLPDGRFLVMQEGRPLWPKATSPALLFAGDPVDRAAPLAFRYAPPRGYRTVDAAALPDGRVLILHRTVAPGLPYVFSAKIALADPRAIRAGKVWRGRVLATIEAPLPVDNFEGMAVAPQPDGSLAIWLISDDNGAVFQRTLLYELVMKP